VLAGPPVLHPKVAIPELRKVQPGNPHAVHGGKEIGGGVERKDDCPQWQAAGECRLAAWILSSAGGTLSSATPSTTSLVEKLLLSVKDFVALVDADINLGFML